MNLSDNQYPKGSYRRLQNRQYVLFTDNGNVRTSRVTAGRIMKAVYEIEANSYVTLEKCTPVSIVREAECFAISFYKDSRVAVYFRVRKTVLRMVRSGMSRDEAANLMCDFFYTARLPDMSAWTCQELSRTSSDSTPELCVDGQNFRYFGSADVVAALENIIEGKSVWMHYDFTFGNGGYMNIFRRGDGLQDAARYKVECVMWTEPTPTGYRTVISDVALLRSLMWELIDDCKFPDPAPGWEEFDVADYFQRLTFRFLDEKDKLNNDER